MGLVDKAIKLTGRLKRSSVTKYWSAAFFPRVVAIVSIFVITPLALKEFGVIGFGYWTLATFATGLVISPDLGIGNSVVNEFSGLRNSGEKLSEQSRRIRSLVSLLGFIACTWLIIGILFALIYSRFVVEGEYAEPTFVALTIGLFCFLTAVPIAIIQKIQLSFEVANKAVLWEGVGKFLSLVLSLSVIYWIPNIYLLIVAYMFPVTITAWINGLRFMRTNQIHLFGGRATMREIFAGNKRTVSIGKWFVVIQVSYLFLTALDLYIVNAFRGPGAVTEVSVIKRPFEVIPVFVSMYAVALWPIFRRLVQSGDEKKLSKYFLIISFFTIGITLIGGIFIMLISPWLYRVISSATVQPDLFVLISVTVLVVMNGVIMVFSSLLNAVSMVKTQAIICIFGSLLSFACKIIGLTNFGIQGFFIFSAASYLLFLFIPLIALIKYSVNRVIQDVNYRTVKMNRE